MDPNHKATSNKDNKIVLQLYVSGMSQRSMEAISNIQKLCNEEFSGEYVLEIIDIYKNPELLSTEHIVFSPSLIKKHPLPKKILIGNFADKQKVIRALGFSLKD